MSIHVAGDRTSLLRLNDTALCGWTTRCLSIFRRWALGSLPRFSSCEHAAVNVAVRISLRDLAFSSLRKVPRRGSAGSHDNSCTSSSRHAAPCSSCTVCHSHRRCTGLPTRRVLARAWCLFHSGRPNGCEVVSLWFHVRFSDDWR